MTFSITLIIVLITIGVSLYASEKLDFRHKLLFNPYRVVHNNEYYRIFSHAFIHADLMHLGVNMYVFFNFGNYLETLFINLFGQIGMLYFILLYIGGIIFATIPALLKNKDNPHYNSLGASGAVSGVLFSFILFNPMMWFTFPPVPAIVFGILYIGYEMYQNKNGRTNIAHDAHLLGALFGVLFTIFLSPKFVISNFIDQIQQIF